MKITVVFDYPEISDPEGEDNLTDDLKKLGNEGEYEWYIDDVVEQQSKKLYSSHCGGRYVWYNGSTTQEECDYENCYYIYGTCY